jgi:response regulator RpfG family c-di-GMP phosphodiesterase
MEKNRPPFQILFVDDEPSAQKYFKLFLSDDAQVHTCSSAAEALAILSDRADVFDAIISDERMPNVTGGELLSAVANRWPRIVRILTTAHINLPRFSQLIADHAVDNVILKPWDADHLSKSLNVALQLHCRKSIPSFAEQFRGDCDGKEWETRTQALDHMPHMLAELAIASQLRIPSLELMATTLDACLDDAFHRLSPTDRSFIAVEWSDIRQVPLRSNVSSLGNALAELIGISVAVVRAGKKGEVILRTAVDGGKISLLISDTGDWQQLRVFGALFETDQIYNDPRCRINLLVAYTTILGCRGRISLLFDDCKRPQTTVFLPILPN